MPREWLTTKRAGGFSPVEVLLAATVLGLLVTALIGSIIYGRTSTATAGERVRAIELAEEGLEAARNIGDAAFANLVGGTTTNVGNTAIGAGSDANINGTSALKVNTGSSSGNVNSISVYIKSIDAVNNSVQVALYADNGSGTSPTTRLAVSAVQTAVANSWNTFTLSGVSVAANTDYWIGFSENGSTFFANVSTGGFSAYRVSNGYPAPNPFAPDSANTVDRPSFYMSVGGGTVGLAQVSNQWTFSGTSDTTGIFTRKLAISSVDSNRKQVTSTVTWPQGNATAEVSVDTYFTNWRASITPPVTPGPIMMAYSKTTTTPFYRVWNGTAWGAEASAQNVVGNINYLVLKSARTRNEAILGVQTSTGAIYVQVWNGTSWGSLTQVGTGPTTTRSFDIAYEKNSDTARIVYTPTSAQTEFAYRSWNGTTLSTETIVTTSPTTGAVNWIELRQNPLSSSNEIAMLLLDANADVYGMAWTGSAWSTMGTASAWELSAASATKKSIDVEYEQNSGEAMFMWGDSLATDQYYRTWNGTTLSAVTLLDIAAEGGVAEWVQLAARPGSDEIMVGVQDAGADLNTRKWSGTAWDTATQHAEHSAVVENITSRVFDIVWETHSANGGKAWLLFGNGTAISTKLWSSTAWGTAATLAGSDDTSFIRLRADAASGAIFAGIYEDSTSATDDIWESRLTGGSATWTAKNSIWAGPTGVTPVFFRVDIATP